MKNYHLRKNVIVKNIEPDFFVLANDGETISSINTIGGGILEHLKAGKNFDEILTDIVTTYDVNRAEAERDLKEFLQELKEGDIVEELN